MARRPKKNEAPSPEDPTIVSGFPNNGDVVNPDPEPDPEQEDIENPDGGDDEGDQPDEVTELKRRLDETQAQLAALQRQPAPHMQPQAPQPPQDINWGERLFEDPQKTLQDFEKHIRQSVRQEMTQEYQKDVGQREFWGQFYRDNPDLDKYRDLVDGSLAANYANLQNLPTAQAAKRLAELTRTRILAIRGGNKPTPQPRRRAVAEGGNPPTDAPPRREPERPTTLGDVIRARHTKRMNGGKAAAA
jgi:hypothetical protein